MPPAQPAVGAPCWIDLYSSDTAAANALYGALLGWTPQEPDPRFGGYYTFSRGGAHVAGCMHNDGGQGLPDGWTVYLMTDDVEAAAARTPDAGGNVDFPPMVVPDNGTMALITDPGGARLGMWQPAAMTGFGLVAEPGAPAWFELHTPAYADCVGFYEDVFGWDTHVMSDTPEFRYTTLGEGDDARAGIMDASGDLRPGRGFWTVYFQVQDVDAALAVVREHDGATVTEPHDTPYGRLAHAVDAGGAEFRLLAR